MIQEKLTQLTPSLNEETFHLYSDVNMSCPFIFDILVFSQMFKNIFFTTTKKKTLLYALMQFILELLHMLHDTTLSLLLALLHREKMKDVTEHFNFLIN